jgi:hypothetical protein
LYDYDVQGALHSRYCFAGSTVLVVCYATSAFKWFFPSGDGGGGLKGGTVPRKKAASLSFDSKPFNKTSFYAKQQTAFRNDVKNSFLDVTPFDLGEA